MPGYRTIPTKDTFDVDERLGGIITIKQLGYLVIAFFLTYVSAILSFDFFKGGSDAVYLPAAIFFLSLLFTFANFDKWLSLRLQYYVLSGSSILEKKPELLRNVRTVEEDKIITLDGRAIAIMKVTPINFPLLSDEAKESKIAAYEMYLRQLVYPIVHLVQSEHVDIEEYHSHLLRLLSGGPSAGMKNMDDYVREHVKFLREYMLSNKARTKSHYVVLQVKDPRILTDGVKRDPFNNLAIGLQAALAEIQPQSLLSGGKLFAKPDHYVMLDLVGRKMIFKNPNLVPSSLPARCMRIGSVLQFESKVSMLRFARSKENSYYFGPVDLRTMIQEEFMNMSLAEREREFSLDERRRHVQLSAGKTRWAYDEVEKHMSVLAEKLEASGLRVHRVRGEELFTGRHASMAEATKVKVAPNYLVVDNTFMKVVYATGYPYQVNLGWLANIVDGREDYDLTMYIYPVSIPEALSTFRSAILKLSTEKKARQDFLDPETEQHLEDVKNFFTQVVSGKEKYFQASLYITCKASSRKALDTVVEKCRSDLAGASIDYDTADYNMAAGVASTRLTGKDRLGKRREFPSSSLAATFPHISSSLEIQPGGIFFAYDWMATPIILDLKNLPNQHISILGESGGGKSYFAKSLIPRYLLSGYSVYVADPDGEYVELARHFGGTITSVGPKEGEAINPLDLEGREPQDKIRSLLGLFSIVCGGQLSKYQESLLADTLERVFTAAQKKRQQITMSDLHDALAIRARGAREQQTRQDLQFLLMGIRPFCKGGIYEFVDRKTTIKIEGRMHVFDLREYQQDKTLKDFFNYVIFDYITHHLQADRSLKALFMDEGWTMVNYAGSENYVRYIIKDSRKYNVSFVFITQELEDMLSSQAGRSILNNTSTQFIFHQKESAMQLLRTTLNLTHEEYERLIACGKGEGLMVSDKYRLMFRVRTNAHEHSIITSDPNERIAQEEAEKNRLAQIARQGNETEAALAGGQDNAPGGPAGEYAAGRPDGALMGQGGEEAGRQNISAQMKALLPEDFRLIKKRGKRHGRAARKKIKAVGKKASPKGKGRQGAKPQKKRKNR